LIVGSRAVVKRIDARAGSELSFLLVVSDRGATDSRVDVPLLRGRPIHDLRPDRLQRMMQWPAMSSWLTPLPIEHIST